MSKTERAPQRDREPRRQPESNGATIECLDCGMQIKWMESEAGLCEDCLNNLNDEIKRIEKEAEEDD